MADQSSDLALVQRVRAGHPDALADAYHRYGESVHRAAYRITGNAADADDVLQDVFVGLPEALRTFAGRGSLEGWLRRVAVRAALMRLRSDGRRRQVPLEDAGIQASRSSDPDGGLVAAAIHREVDALPETLRTVFVLKEIEGYSHAEIGAMLGIRANTSEVRLFRARRALHDRLRGLR